MSIKKNTLISVIKSNSFVLLLPTSFLLTIQVLIFSVIHITIAQVIQFVNTIWIKMHFFCFSHFCCEFINVLLPLFWRHVTTLANRMNIFFFVDILKKQSSRLMKQIHFSKAKAWFEQIAYNREQTKHTKSSQSKSYCHPIIVNKNE